MTMKLRIFSLLLLALFSPALCSSLSRSSLLSVSPLIAASPLITNVTGCSHGYPPHCLSGNLLTITGSGFTSPITNVTIQERYLCRTVIWLSDSSVTCRVPDVDWQDRARPLSLRITAANATSPSYPTAFLTYGVFSITSISGCLNSTAGRASGCRANDSVTLYGTGFVPEGPDQALVAGIPCAAVRVLSNESMVCVLPQVEAVWTWLTLNVEMLGQWVFVNQAVMYDPWGPPAITRLTGCHDSGVGSLTGCRTGQQLVIYGTQLTSVNLTILIADRFPCNNTRLFATNCLTCEVPDLPRALLNRTLQVTVRCDSRVSEPYAGGLSSFGRLAISRVTGCAEQTHNGSYACKAGEAVVLHGTGLGFPGGLPSNDARYDLSVVLDPGSIYINRLQCLNVSVHSNERAVCYLPPPSIASYWYAVGVQAGGNMAVSARGNALVQYAAVPIIASIAGCWSGSGYNCHGGEVLTITGPAGSFTSPPSVTIGGRYVCGSPALLSATRVQCVMPNVSWEDYGAVMAARVTCGNVTSSPYAGVQSFGPMAVTGASGCARNDYNGTAPWRTSGCRAGDVVNITGTGLGGVVSVIVGSTPRSGACWPTDVVDNRTTSCTLDKFDATGVWLQVLVWSGVRTSVGLNLVQYAPKAKDERAEKPLEPE